MIGELDLSIASLKNKNKLELPWVLAEDELTIGYDFDDWLKYNFELDIYDGFVVWLKGRTNIKATQI